MPSSTSNSNGRIPAGLSRREGLLAALLALALLAGSELFLRAYGVWPAVADTTLWWSMNRAQARGDRVMVILGSSRALLGIDPGELRRAFPGTRVLHLGIDGTAPYAVLQDLAGDEAFRGLIVCELTADALLPRARDRARPWVDFYRAKYPGWDMLEKRFNEWARVQLQSRLVLLSPAMGLSTMVLLGPYKSYEHMRADRFRPAFYRDRMTPERLAAHRRQRVERTRELAKDAVREGDGEAFLGALRGEVRDLYAALRRRGARLVFVQLPTTDEHWEVDERILPRARFWDLIEPETGIPTIHFRDDPELAGFDCPDTSHLDARDAPLFTRRLAERIKQCWEPRDGTSAR